MDGWRVDPDRVIGVLAGVDDAGLELGAAVRAVSSLTEHGHGALQVAGRKTVALAWEGFMQDRETVPPKLIAVITKAAGAVSEATLAVLAGDEQMASHYLVAEQDALNRWGIDSTSAYQTPTL